MSWYVRITNFKIISLSGEWTLMDLLESFETMMWIYLWYDKKKNPVHYPITYFLTLNIVRGGESDLMHFLPWPKEGEYFDNIWCISQVTSYQNTYIYMWYTDHKNVFIVLLLILIQVHAQKALEISGCTQFVQKSLTLLICHRHPRCIFTPAFVFVSVFVFVFSLQHLYRA